MNWTGFQFMTSKTAYLDRQIIECLVADHKADNGSEGQKINMSVAKKIVLEPVIGKSIRRTLGGQFNVFA